MSFIVIFAVFSLALFAYWFRYSCLLILRTRTAEDFGLRVGRANGLSFDQVKVEMEQSLDHELSALYHLLEKDYGIITRLLQNVAATTPNENRREITLLRVNFRLTQALFLLSYSFGLSYARQALEELADTVEHFANSFGEQSEAQVAA
jgi:hypothetical protein